MHCSTGMHFKNSPFSSLYQQFSVRFRSSLPYYVCWWHRLVLLKQEYKYSFLKVNNNLQIINERFIFNKLSFNVNKNKYSFLYKSSKKDNIPLILPKLNINNREIAPTGSVKFLGVFLGEKLPWKPHTKNTFIIWFQKILVYYSKQNYF